MIPEQEMREAGQCSLKLIPLPHMVLDIFIFEFQGKKRSGQFLIILKLKKPEKAVSART